MKSGKGITKRTGLIVAPISLLLIFIILINFCVLSKRCIDQKNLENEIEEINQIVCPDPENRDANPQEPNTDYFNFLKIPLDEVDIKKFKNINDDTVGFLNISGTKVNYPVVQTTDNKFYLKHSFKKSSNNLGWLFMDYRNSSESFDKNTVIYGHSNLDKTMFGSLNSVLSREWSDNPNNGKIKFINLSGVTDWKIISAYTVPAEAYYIKTDFRSDESFRTWLSKISERSVYNYGYKPSLSDKIMTFSTCYKDEGNIRLVIHAKKI